MPQVQPSPLGYRLRLLASYLHRSPICPGPPPTAIVATTHRCNMTCRMCIRAVRAFNGPNMEFDLFRRIIDGSSPYLRYLSLDGPGETTMYPEAFEMIRYARAKGIRVMFSTNCTLLDEAMNDAIMDSGVDLIIFSVNGATSDVYEAVHGRACYHQVIANIHAFLKQKRRRRARILVVVQMVILDETRPQVGAFCRMWRRTPGVDLVRVKKDVVCCYGMGVADERSARLRKNPCSRLWHGPPFIDTDGSVYASPGVLYKAGPVGSLKEQSLAGIWNGEKMQAMRLGQISGDVSSFAECLDCAYLQPRLPLTVAGFLLGPFAAGKLMPLAEKLALWYRLPLFERFDPR
jgi:pyruvate-formate lyase-activating enzyme